MSCRDKVREAVTDYNKRYESYKLREAVHDMTKLRNEAEQQVFTYLRKQLCIENNLQATAVATSENGLDAYYARIGEKNDAFAKAVKLLDAHTKQQPEIAQLDKVQDYTKQLQRLLKDAENNYNILCSLDKKLCECPT